MMMNKFNIFDPMIFNLPMNWLFMLLTIMMMNYNYWIFNKLKINKFINNLNSNMLLNNNKYNNKTINNLFYSLLIMLMINNFMNLFPYMFSASNNIIMSFSLSLFLWMMFLITSIMNNYKTIFINFSIYKTTLMLINFIIMIELLSLFIRLFTLSIRLNINLMLNHLIINMINNTYMMMLYMMMEFMMIFIQAYVFYMLNILYYNEIF